MTDLPLWALRKAREWLLGPPVEDHEANVRCLAALLVEVRVETTAPWAVEAVEKRVRAEAQAGLALRDTELTSLHVSLDKAEAKLAEAQAEIERLKIIEASLESGMRLRQEALDLAEARVEELREAVRLALDALTDAEHYHARACAKDEPHDHPLLRKLQATIPLVDAALAAFPEPAPPEEKP